ncbi:MAG TPA: M3 family metallopeptidase [Dehalococcoidia bacterium]|nr:M3 family metallopeptidase [Dehalococcoidia bacterium]
MAAAQYPLFDYAAVTSDAIREGVDGAIASVERLLDGIVAVPSAERSFANTVVPFDELAQVVDDANGRYAFLAYVSTEKELRDVAHEYEEKLSTYMTGIGFREDVYAALSAFAASDAASTLDEDEARLLRFSLRDFKRNGMELGEDERTRLRELKERLVTLGIEFSRNIDGYDDAIHPTGEQLSGLPDAFIAGLTSSEEDAETRYRVSLDYPEFYPFMESADDTGMRHELFLKNHNKAADSNVSILTEAIAVRDEIASILGYDSWADYIVEVKMAKTPQAALDFLVDLEARVQEKAAVDMAGLAASKAGDPYAEGEGVEIWDWRYYVQRVLREEHNVDQFEIAKYFPLDATLGGLFDVYQRLVNVRFVPVEDANAWHPDVRTFAVHEADDDSGEAVAYFYMDLHPRPDKFGHAAAFSLQSGRQLDGGYRTPASAIVANFTKPTDDQPSLLRHSEVVTLFHEFGHILHQVMTRARFMRFSGTSVERDFVEAPSQMLEHWCWDSDVLTSFTSHYETGEPIPEDLVQRMVAAKNVGSGITALRQIYFGRIDLAFHAAGREKDTDAIARELHSINGFAFPEETHFQAGFGHLFGYDAGYYGYMWSKVFGDDMFTRFEAAGIGDPSVGRDYRELILEPGGTVDGDALVRGFLGREPNTEAFMRDLGLTE